MIDASIIFVFTAVWWDVVWLKKCVQQQMMSNQQPSSMIIGII